jgi:hypothetical protein
MNKFFKKVVSIISLSAMGFAVIQNPSNASGSTISQWAIDGTASSSYAKFEPEYAAGAPDTDECDDSEAAWASVESDTVEWLAMDFETAVVPQEINIYQNNIQGAISKVEVSANGTDWIEVYSGSVDIWYWGTCDLPDTTVFFDIFTVNNLNGEFPNFAVSKFKITVDQTAIDEWAEIDAVRLIGIPSASVRASATVKPSISGKAVSNKAASNKLTANKGTWNGTPDPTFAYKWFACKTKVAAVKQTIPSNCKAIAGANKKTLAVKTAMKGDFIAVKVTGTSEGTNPTWYLSKSTAKVK